MIGTVLDKYEILEEVGQGGMATVYRARDLRLLREVAIKVLHPHLARQEEARCRFQREAEAVARLRHPNILEIYDYSGKDAALAYMVTEFIRGESLRQHLNRREPTLPESALLIAVPLLEALQHAHEHGIIHRDVKPENVLVREDGTIKLADFGIAHLVDGQGMTVTGALLGSPAHMSPEQILGEELGPASDLFSLGTVLYRMVTGRLPYEANNAQALFQKVLNARHQPAPQLQPLVSDRLGRIIDRALAPTVTQRYHSAATLASDLREELAESGLTDLPAELRAYLADPAGYEAVLRGRLLERLIQRAGELLAAGQRARALSYYSRALAIEPTEPRVLAAVESLGRGHRLRRIVRWGGGAALVTGAAGLLLWLDPLGWSVPAPVVPPVPSIASPGATLRSRMPGQRIEQERQGATPGSGDRQSSEPLQTAHSATPSAVLPSSGTPRARPGTGAPLAAGTPSSGRAPSPREAALASLAGGAPRDPAARGATGAATATGRPPTAATTGEPARPVELRIRTFPFTQLELDGKPLGWPMEQHLLSLPQGEHQIALKHPACRPVEFRYTVTPQSRSETRRLNLEWLPATVQADGPEGAVLYVERDGRRELLGEASPRIRLRLPMRQSQEKVTFIVVGPDEVTELTHQTMVVQPAGQYHLYVGQAASR